MSFLIHIQHEDDLLAVVDRVLMADDDDVTLVVPEGARIFASEDNLALLQREAEAGGKRVVLRTSDPRGRTLAARSGIPTQAVQPPGGRVFSDIVAPGAARPAPAPPPPPAAAPPPKPEPAPEPEPEPESEPEPAASEESRDEKAFPEHLAAVVGGSGADDATDEAESGPDGAADAVAPAVLEADASGQGALPLAGLPEEPLPFLSGGEQKKAKKQKREGRSFALSGMLGGRFGAAAIMLLGIAVAFLVANEVLPSVEVRIQPKSEVITFSVPVRVAVGSAEAGDVPGQRVQVAATEERTAAASGEAEVTERASGTITISNAFSSDSQTLVATTRFVSQDGKLFRLDNTIVVPGAEIVDGEIQPSTIDATVTADEPGEEYNIGPSTFSIPGFQGSPKYNKFTARSSEPMRGGASGVVRVVTEEDITSVRQGIEDALAEKLEQEFAIEVLVDLIVADDARDMTITVDVDAEAGDPQDRVTAKAEGTLSAIAYRREDLEEYVLTALRERIPADTDVVEGSTTITPTVLEINNETGT